MKLAKPPFFATWMLERFTSGADHDPVIGDLLEEYRAGRSAGWFWRQVGAAIMVAFSRTARTHWLAVFFAALWSFIPRSLPGIYFLRDIGNSHFMGSIYSLDWPYSTILSLGIFFGLDILYLWLGLFFSLLVDSVATRSLHGMGMLRGMWIGLLSYIPIWTAFAILPIFPGHRIDMRHITSTQLLFDPKLMLYRLPYLLCLLFSLWKGLPRSDRRISKRIS